MWFKVDDHLPQHRKVLSIPRKQRLAAIGLWTLAGAWCGGQNTDGAVPAYVVEELGGTAAQAELLVKAGLWEVTPDGWLFHDWQQANFTAEQVDAKREAWRDRQRRSRAGKSRVTRDTGVTHTDSHESVTRESTSPDPTRPDPIPTRGLGGVVDLPLGGRADTNRRQATDLVNAHRAARIKSAAGRMPSAVAGKMIEQTAALLADGYPAEQVAEAMIRLDQRGLGPGALPMMVDDLQRGPAVAAALPRHQRERDAQDAEWDALYGPSPTITPRPELATGDPQ